MSPDKPDLERHMDNVFGKEEKLGPAPIKPHVQVLLEDLQRVLRSIANNRLVSTPLSKEAEELRQRVGSLLGAMRQKRLSDQQVFAEWKPTEANIKALPVPIRAHIEDCEKLIKDNEALREQLNLKFDELRALISMDRAQAENLITTMKEWVS